jgi:hypothetical protein
MVKALTILKTKIVKPITSKIGASTLAQHVIAVIIALFVFAILTPIALNQVYTTNTSGWNSAVATLFNVFVPVMAILAVAIGFVVIFLRKR